MGIIFKNMTELDDKALAKKLTLYRCIRALFGTFAFILLVGPLVVLLPSHGETKPDILHTKFHYLGWAYLFFAYSCHVWIKFILYIQQVRQQQAEEFFYANNVAETET